mmetsp:Transcript_6777/g.9868  ORF Transcript_6777/g.9868 Transcript_6777/m.9868 type:complete len:330 (-) Transcript_6777:1314-2303(-)
MDHPHAVPSSHIDKQNVETKTPPNVVSTPDNSMVPGSLFFGRYQFHRILGKGSYGEVHLAYDFKSQMWVAIKVIACKKEQGIPHFLIREISCLKSLQHPNIIRLYKIAIIQEDIHMIMEYADQSDLKALLKNQQLSLPQIKYLAHQLLKGLNYIHSHSIMHRDLKPDNILITAQGQIKIADFGLSRSFAIPIRKLSAEVVSLWYRAPDILLGSEHYGYGADIWSAGCIIGEMLIGQQLFEGVDPVSQLLKIFTILGTPNTTNWPGMQELPRYQQMVRSRPEFKIDYKNVFDRQLGKFDSAGMDLVKSMLQYDPSRRISAETALKHPFFK